METIETGKYYYIVVHGALRTFEEGTARGRYAQRGRAKQMRPEGPHA